MKIKVKVEQTIKGEEKDEMWHRFDAVTLQSKIKDKM